MKTDNEDKIVVDYEDLLAKYISHVGYEEGTDFIDSLVVNSQWSEEDIKAIEELRHRYD